MEANDDPAFLPVEERLHHEHFQTFQTATGTALLRCIQPEQAVAEVYDALAGRREILFRNLVEPVAPDHDQTGFAHAGQMPGREVGRDADAFGNLRDH